MQRDLNALVSQLKKLIYEYLQEGLNYKISGILLDRLRYKILTKIPMYEIPKYSFQIGNIKIESPIVSAPMAGISDNTYRIFARFFGSALTFTEMISSYGLYYGQDKTLSLARVSNFERPCAVQIFGSEPDIMAAASKKVEEIADIIDINMGCPVPKVLKSRSGGYLLQDEEKIEKIVSNVVNAVKKPVTIKTRIGWDSSNINILKIAKIAEANGVSAITIHGRTVKQGFSGKVNYEIIKKVKDSVKIPVIVSGDIDSPRKAKDILEYTSCDGAMLGRISKGSIWVFLNTFLFLACQEKLTRSIDIRSTIDAKGAVDTELCGEDVNDSDRISGKFGNKEVNYIPNFTPSLKWKKDYAKLYLKFLIYFKSEEKAVKEYRKILGWIFKGERGVGHLRREFPKLESYKDTVCVIERIGSF